MAKRLWERFVFLDVTVFVHPHVNTFLESASLTLIPMSLVNIASAISSLTSKTDSIDVVYLESLKPVNEPPSD